MTTIIAPSHLQGDHKYYGEPIPVKPWGETSRAHRAKQS